MAFFIKNNFLKSSNVLAWGVTSFQTQLLQQKQSNRGVEIISASHFLNKFRCSFWDAPDGGGGRRRRKQKVLFVCWIKNHSAVLTGFTLHLWGLRQLLFGVPGGRALQLHGVPRSGHLRSRGALSALLPAWGGRRGRCNCTAGLLQLHRNPRSAGFQKWVCRNDHFKFISHSNKSFDSSSVNYSSLITAASLIILSIKSQQRENAAHNFRVSARHSKLLNWYCKKWKALKAIKTDENKSQWH